MPKIEKGEPVPWTEGATRELVESTVGGVEGTGEVSAISVVYEILDDDGKTIRYASIPFRDDFADGLREAEELADAIESGDTLPSGTKGGQILAVSILVMR